MRRELLIAVIALSGAGYAPLTTFAQTHKVAKPEDVVRAVGVYEWIGDRAKPTASRLIPVTVFINGELQDAGIYQPQPIPFALDPETIYEIDKAGVPEGTLDLVYARNLRSSEATGTFDDGWFGYGKFAVPPPPKKQHVLKPSQTLATITSSKDNPDSDRPTLARRPGSSDKTPAASTPDPTAAQPPADPDRPHLTKKPDSSTTQDPAASTDKTTAEDTSTDKTNTASSGSTSSADPDRPTLKKRTPEEAKKARKEAQQSSASGLATSLNDDPYRPTLHHGNMQQELTEADLPKLKGIPINLEQAVAVSDAKTRPTHDFSRPWADDAERATILAKMQAIARTQLAAYATKQPPAAPANPAVKRTPNSKLRRGRTADSPAPLPPLLDEHLSGFTLSYGGAATYIYTARTDGEGPTLRYVTIVAQMTPLNELASALQSVTDATHLDRTPWMRLVDVVDADASNRASLLFELRGQTSRQFALYRVIAARSEQLFLTGSTQ